jgi:hypothetical protein
VPRRQHDDAPKPCRVHAPIWALMTKTRKDQHSPALIANPTNESPKPRRASRHVVCERVRVNLSIASAMLVGHYG